MARSRVQRMRRPIEFEESRRSDRLFGVFYDPAGVFSALDHPRNPRFEIAGHFSQRGPIALAHLGKHGVAMRRDQRRIRNRGGTSRQHDA